MSTTGRTILIVDDDRLVRETLRQIAESMGHEAIMVERATRARQVLEEQSVDAMLLDLQMPGGHGDQLLMYLKKRQARIPPTIVISAFLNRGRIGPLIGLGVEGIVAKPFRVNRIVEELERVLSSAPDAHFVYCTQCGTAAPESGQQCRKCDAHLERTFSCPVCDTLHGPGARFCSQCGERLGMDRFRRPAPNDDEADADGAQLSDADHAGSPPGGTS